MRTLSRRNSILCGANSNTWHSNIRVPHRHRRLSRPLLFITHPPSKYAYVGCVFSFHSAYRPRAGADFVQFRRFTRNRNGKQLNAARAKILCEITVLCDVTQILGTSLFAKMSSQQELKCGPRLGEQVRHFPWYRIVFLQNRILSDIKLSLRFRISMRRLQRARLTSSTGPERTGCFCSAILPTLLPYASIPPPDIFARICVN
jgi:hypothetical protein